MENKSKQKLLRECILYNKKLILKNIGEILKEERKKEGISRFNLSDRLNISENYIGYIEQGRYEISLSKFILITNELGLNPNYIINRSIEKINLGNDDLNIEEKDIAKEILLFLKKN